MNGNSMPDSEFNITTIDHLHLFVFIELVDIHLFTDAASRALFENGSLPLPFDC